jgi:hypothetical protein
VPLAPASSGTIVELAPAKTRVGIARVNLEVRDLRLESSDKIVGTYEIKIPLAPWRNDRGEISLHAPEPLEQLTTGGGTLSGSGLSEDGRIHRIVCRFEPDGFVGIHVTTPDRDLDFRTRYELVAY